MAKHRKKQSTAKRDPSRPTERAPAFIRGEAPVMPAPDAVGRGAELQALLEDTLAKNQKPLRLDDFLRILHLPRKRKKELEQTLLGLQGEGKVARTPGGGFALAGQLKVVRGVLAVQRAGMGFLTTDTPGADIYIHPAHMGDAWHGDTVEAVILPGKRGRSAEGRIVSVISRGQKEVGVYATKRRKDGRWLCVPSSPRLQVLFSVDVQGLSAPVHQEDLLLVTPGEKIQSGLWEATASYNLEHEENPAAQERLTKSNHSIPDSFSRAVLNETANLPPDPQEEDFAHRRDLRDMDFVTIDGASARDFDDAICVEAKGRGWRLLVAIADVSHYVRPATALDNEARLRGNSYYFPLSVEPMLPEALSNGLCSLRPNQPRLAMVADLLLKADGTPGGAEFYPAVIESKARLTYEQVHGALEEESKEDQASIGRVLPMLKEAHALAKVMAKARDARGSLDFDLPEPEFLFNAKGEIQGVRPRPKLFAHRLIEEFMVAANEAVARYITAQHQPMLYRIHPAPSEEKLEALFNLLRRSGLGLPAGIVGQSSSRGAPIRQRNNAKNGPKNGKPVRAKAANGGPARKAVIIPTPLDLRSILEESRGTEREYIINRLILRSMMQAQYSLDNEGHYGLASACYCHFTSPIRRYADLTVHRSLKKVLKSERDDNTPPPQETPEPKMAGKNAKEGKQAGKTTVKPEFSLAPIFLINTATHINATERTAMEAEREIQKRLTVLYLHDRLGEEFDGTISGVTDFGFFVEMDGVMAEGMVRLSTLGDDYYEYFQDRQELVGRTTNRSFTLGQRVRVKLTDANLSRQEVNLNLVDKPNARPKKAGRPRLARPDAASRRR